MSTNTKLAEALRACMADIELWMETYKRQTGSLEVLDLAREALAAHDAEQAALRDLECPPDPEMVDRALAAADQKRAYALAARQQAPVPEGFVLVPVEFIEAGQRVAQEYARTNPKWPMWDNGEAEPKVQDPCGVHAWLEQAAMLAAAPRPEAGAGWQPISTAPKDGRKMLLFYLNANGQARRVIGGWVTAEEAAETDADDVGLEAGWYERIDNWPDYYQVAIHEGEPTHWMPLPAAPGAATGEQR